MNHLFHALTMGHEGKANKSCPKPVLQTAPVFHSMVIDQLSSIWTDPCHCAKPVASLSHSLDHVVPQVAI